jgi:hypothetical protein
MLGTQVNAYFPSVGVRTLPRNIKGKNVLSLLWIFLKSKWIILQSDELFCSDSKS